MGDKSSQSVQPVDYERQLVGALNGGALALVLSIGHRLGLLDRLASDGPITSDGLARETACTERYVREWLGALTTSGLAEVDAGAQTYRLAEGAADLLTRAGSMNLAVFMQYLAVLGSVEDQIVDCFRSGGGLGYDRFPRFHEVMAEDSAMTVLAALDDAILPLVPGLKRRLAAGMDVIDVGCGSGRALIALARTYPASRFVGIDLDDRAIEAARGAASGLENLTFRRLDAAELTSELGPETFDVAFTFDAIHDQAHPDRMLRELREVLRPDGVYLAQDIAGGGSHAADRDHPLGCFLYTISLMHCMTVSLSAGGAGLGAMWGIPLTRQYLAEAGFSRVEQHRLEHDLQNAYYVCHKQ